MSPQLASQQQCAFENKTLPKNSCLLGSERQWVFGDKFSGVSIESLPGLTQFEENSPGLSWVGYVSLLLCCWDKTSSKANLWRRAFISSFISRVTIHHWGTPGQEAGTEMGAAEERSLPPNFSQLSQLLFIHNPGPPDQGLHHTQWNGPSRVNQQSETSRRHVHRPA